MGLLVAAAGRIDDLGGRRHLVAGPLELRLLDLVVADASDRVLRGLDVAVRYDQKFDVALVLERAQPLALLVHEVGGDFHRHLGDDLGGAVLADLLTDQAQQGERHRLDGADAADAGAARAHLVARIAERGAQALARHLEHAEARQTADLDARTVHLHRIAQAIFDGALVARFVHVDEVDDDQTADVADAQLAGDLVGRLEVRVGGRGLDVAAARGARGVDVDRDQRLGVVDDDRAARGQLHLVCIGRFDLALDLVAVEERDVIRVHLQASTAFRRHETLHVLGGDGMGTRFVDQHLADVIREVVPQGARDGVALAIDQERRGTLEHRLDDLFPLDAQVVEVPLEFLDGPADAGRAHDGAHALRHHQGVHDALDLVALLALDAAAHAACPRVVGHQHQETPGERDEGREGGTLVAAFLFVHLHDDVLAFLQDLAHVDAPARGVLQEVLPGDLFQRQEAVALGAVVDEAGLERRLDARDARLVDVGFFLFAGRKFDREVVELLSVNQGDAQFFLLRRVHEHSFHGGPLYGKGPTVTRRSEPMRRRRARTSGRQSSCCCSCSCCLPGNLRTAGRNLLWSGRRRRAGESWGLDAGRGHYRPDSMASSPRTN